MENRGGPFCRLVSRVKIICEIATFVVFYDGYLVYSDHSLIIIIKRLIASYLYFRVYLPCDYEADRLLCRMYDEGKSISLLSDIFERTKEAIRSRLKKLGKIQ